MTFKNETLKCAFTLPDPLRLRHIEQYEKAKEEARLAGAQFGISINWVGAVALIEDWKCKSIPNHKDLDLEALGDVHGEVLQTVVWVAGQVVTHIFKEMAIPKN